MHSLPTKTICSITLHYIALHCIALHYITLHYITLHYITLHYVTLRYVTLRYVTLHYITLCYVTLHYITLHYITLHCRNYRLPVNIISQEEEIAVWRIANLVKVSQKVFILSVYVTTDYNRRTKLQHHRLGEEKLTGLGTQLPNLALRNVNLQKQKKKTLLKSLSLHRGEMS